MAHRQIKVVVFADLICPYTYLGHKALMDAIDECSDLPLGIEVEYRAFRLISALPEDHSVDRRAYFTNKWGDKYSQIQKMIQGMAKSLGLLIVSDGKVSQTTRAHRLARKAYLMGGEVKQQALLNALFIAYFAEGKDIGDLNVLGDVAQSIGLMPKEEAINFVKSNELKDEIDRTISVARANGIAGSPVVIVDGKFKLDGVQPKETYLQVFKRLGKCEHMRAKGSPCSDTSSDGTISPPNSLPAVC